MEAIAEMPVQVAQAPGRMAQGVTLGTAIQSMLVAKTKANLRPTSLKMLRLYLGTFAKGRESMPVADVDVYMIEDWFNGRAEAPSSQSSNTGRLSSLLGFCERRGWIHKNPCRMLEKIRLERKPPSILSPAQAETLIETFRRESPWRLAYFTLALYAGIRPMELEKVSWESVNLELGTVMIDAAASKVRKRRIVNLHPKAVALLKEAKAAGAKLPTARMTRRRYTRYAAKMMGFAGGWPQDILRHSAASYSLALHGDAGKVARQLGNSVQILLNHYVELISEEDCKRFWALPEAPSAV